MIRLQFKWDHRLKVKMQLAVDLRNDCSFNQFLGCSSTRAWSFGEQALCREGTFQPSAPRLARGKILNATSVPMTVATDPAQNMSSSRPVSNSIRL